MRTVKSSSSSIISERPANTRVNNFASSFVPHTGPSFDFGDMSNSLTKMPNAVGSEKASPFVLHTEPTFVLGDMSDGLTEISNAIGSEKSREGWRIRKSNENEIFLKLKGGSIVTASSIR